MELPELPKIPDGAKKYVPYIAVGGVVIAAVVLSSRRSGSVSSQPVAAPTGAPVPSNPFSSSSLAGSTGSVGSLPATQVQPQDDGLSKQLSFFDAFYLPVGGSPSLPARPGAAANATGQTGSGLSRFDYYNKSVLAQQSGQVELAAKATQIQNAAQLEARKQEADIAQRQKDRDENLFRNPSNFLKGIGDVGNSLSKVFGIKW